MAAALADCKLVTGAVKIRVESSAFIIASPTNTITAMVIIMVGRTRNYPRSIAFSSSYAVGWENLFPYSSKPPWHNTPFAIGPSSSCICASLNS